MPYYIRLFSKNPEPAPLQTLRESLPPGLRLEVTSGTEDAWQECLLTAENGDEVCQLEWRPRSSDELGSEEIEEFIAYQDDVEPSTAAEWVKEYLASCQSLYACQFLPGGFTDEFGGAPGKLIRSAQSAVGGIVHAEGEGFSNERGFHITWGFSDRVKGPWFSAVLDSSGRWLGFKMDLGNRKHRIAFKAGQVPDGLVIEHPEP